MKQHLTLYNTQGNKDKNRDLIDRPYTFILYVYIHRFFDRLETILKKLILWKVSGFENTGLSCITMYCWQMRSHSDPFGIYVTITINGIYSWATWVLHLIFNVNRCFCAQVSWIKWAWLHNLVFVARLSHPIFQGFSWQGHFQIYKFTQKNRIIRVP